MKTIRFLPLLFGFIAFVLFFSGITRHDVSEEEYLKLGQQKQFDCVGQVLKDTSAAGSCVLISDRYVLTAAHVLEDEDFRIDSVRIDGQNVVAFVPVNSKKSVATRISVMFKGEKFRVKRIVFNKSFVDSLRKGACDLAILELEQPVNDIDPAKLNTKFNELNSKIVGVGFGASGPADHPELVEFQNKKIAGENVVDSIGGPVYSGIPARLFCDFDSPDNPDCNKMGSPDPRPLEYLSAGGDSGGGMFRKSGGHWELIGICSGGGINIQQFMKTYYYGQIMEWTRVAVFVPWITSVIK